MLHEFSPMVGPINQAESAGSQYKNDDGDGPLYEGLPLLLLPVHV